MENKGFSHKPFFNMVNPMFRWCSKPGVWFRTRCFSLSIYRSLFVCVKFAYHMDLLMRWSAFARWNPLLGQFFDRPRPCLHRRCGSATTAIAWSLWLSEAGAAARAIRHWPMVNAWATDECCDSSMVDVGNDSWMVKNGSGISGLLLND